MFLHPFTEFQTQNSGDTKQFETRDEIRGESGFCQLKWYKCKQWCCAVHHSSIW